MKCEISAQPLFNAVRLCCLSGVKILSYRHETDKSPVIILCANPVDMIHKNTRVEVSSVEDRGDYNGFQYMGVWIIWKK